MSFSPLCTTNVQILEILASMSSGKFRDFGDWDMLKCHDAGWAAQ